jgi:hypothetical protein
LLEQHKILNPDCQFLQDPANAGNIMIGAEEQVKILIL